MRENRMCGSEGGEAQSPPYPYPLLEPKMKADATNASEKPLLITEAAIARSS